jgi:tetratricopeptide (TPR) repeat protein/predicted Ser/Thr protein kinase
MSGQLHPRQDTLPPSVAERVDRVCDRFEAAWKAARTPDERPRIEDYLSETPETERSLLLSELIALDIAYRRRAGENPATKDYQDRFTACDGAQLATLFSVIPETAPPEQAGSATPTASDRPTPPVADSALEAREGIPGENQRATPEDPYATWYTDAPAGQPAAAAGWPTVAGYKILGMLGKGGMGVVYKARQLALNRLVALKMIRSGAAAGPEELHRFQMEAKVIALLQHPNIVQIYEVGEHDGQPYLALELVDGRSLHERIKTAPLPAREAAQLTGLLARAMHVVHQRGVIHRDLKPANVLLAADGTPKITDFGLAKRVDVEVGQTSSGAVMGTAQYMPPEQARGHTRQIGPLSDVYALGALMYETLTGRPPFQAATVYDTLSLVVTAEPLPPSRLQPAVPRDLETICLKCLQKEPAKRYASALALAEDLGRFLAGEPIHARPTGPWERMVKWARRRPAAAALLAVLGAMAFAFLGLILWHNGQLQTAVLQVRQEVERQANERQHVAELRAQYEALLLAGQEAFAREDWQNARLELSRALQAIADEPELTDSEVVGRRLLDEAERRSLAQQARRNALEKYSQFQHKRQEALFYRTLYTGPALYTGMDPPDLARTRKALLEALDLYGLSIETEAGPVLDPLLQERHQEIVAGCYELLLLLAEVVVHPPQPIPEEAADHVRQALHILDRAAKLGPGTHPTQAYHLRRARYLDRLGDGPGAATERQRANQLKPVSSLDYFLIGEEWYEQDKPGLAIKAFKDALRRQPGDFWSRYFLAICHLKLRRPTKPAEDRVALTAAKAALSSCLAQRPNFLGIYLLRGFVSGELGAHGEEGAYEDAEFDFRKAWELQPDDAAKYVLYTNRGAMRYRQGKLDDAVADFQQAIALKRRQYNAYVNLAVVYYKRKSLDQALEQLNQAIRLESKVAALYRMRALVQRECRDAPAALRDLAQAIQLESPGSPFRASDYTEKAALLYQAKRFQEAVAACDVALMIRDDYPTAHRHRAEALIGLAEAESDRTKQLACYKEAVRSFERYLEKGRRLPQVYQACARTKAKLENYAEAIVDYTRAIDLEPNASVYAARGWLYLICDAPKLALSDFEKALQLNPESGDAYNGRGFARVKLGQFRLAVNDAQEALRRGPAVPGQVSRLFYNAARIYAQASVKLDQEAARRNLRAPGTHFVYQDRALELLLKALESLPASQRRSFWQKVIQPDTDLNPLRSSTYFRQLAEKGAP